MSDSPSAADRPSLSSDHRVAAVAEVLLELAKLPVGELPCAEAVCAHVTEAVATSLDVERVGVWVLEEVPLGIRLIDGYQHGPECHHTGTWISAESAQPYFTALNQERFIVANDARNHPATSCFTAGYLEPLGITAMLDTPIIRDGKLWGVLCLEHVGDAPRRWSSTEQSLAAALADCTASMMERHVRIQLERALASQQSHIERALRFDNLERMVCGMMHDFRNVLTVIGGGFDLIDRKRNNMTVLERNLQRMRSALAEGVAMCARLDDFVRVDASAQEVLEASEFVTRMRPEMEATAGKMRRIHFQTTGNDCVRMEPAHLRMVMQNLLQNAQDATAPGGSITITVRQESSFSNRPRLRPGAYVVLSVGDDGCGMAKAFIDRLGEPYLTTKPEGSGGGLGLPTVMQIVARASGDVVVESEPSIGTTVHVWLPVHVA